MLAIGPNHPFSQKAFAAALQLPYPVLSDWPDLKVAQCYGIASTRQPLAQLGIAERAFFLVDQQGIIRQRWLIEGGEDVIVPSESLLKGIQEMVGKP